LVELESSNLALGSLWSDLSNLVEDLSKINGLKSSECFDWFLKSLWELILWKINHDLLISLTACLLAVFSIDVIALVEVVSDRLAILSDSPVSVILWFVCTLVVDFTSNNWNSWLLSLLSNFFSTSAAVVGWVIVSRSSEFTELLFNITILAESSGEDRARISSDFGFPSWSIVALGLFTYPLA